MLPGKEIYVKTFLQSENQIQHFSTSRRSQIRNRRLIRIFIVTGVSAMYDRTARELPISYVSVVHILSTDNANVNRRTTSFYLRECHADSRMYYCTRHSDVFKSNLGQVRTFNRKTCNEFLKSAGNPELISSWPCIMVEKSKKIEIFPHLSILFVDANLPYLISTRVQDASARINAVSRVLRINGLSNHFGDTRLQNYNMHL